MRKELMTVLFPNTCIGCGNIIDENEFLCDYCAEMIERYNFDKFCIKCGNYKSLCRCSKQVFYFDGCVAPFKYTGIARRCMHSFKFRHKENISLYFAEQMALAVKQCYYDVNFDVVCCLPIERLKGMRRGYNQTEILGMKIAKILNLPFCNNALGFKGRKKIQHKTPLNERFKNVKDIFYPKISFKDKNILLVDDIKTTGATLSECAKVLLESGCNKVYCVTGLAVERKKRKNGN
ncbi:MAG: ComF family protein [Clostridia bacterium]|nr:ComF family protein [Clostridia bacterium]